MINDKFVIKFENFAIKKENIFIMREFIRYYYCRMVLKSKLIYNLQF